MAQPVIYEITAVVKAKSVKDYEKYMRERHIPDLIETGYFRGAKFTRSSENRYRIQYEAYDQKSLDEYLKTSAEQLRTDFNAHFPEGVDVFRENWEVLQNWQ